MALSDQPTGRPPWLEVIDGDAPLLLIAPHGGRAGAAADATLHPKVNDLQTADITRDLAHRIGAPALINFAMDRNQIDCNRLSQLVQRAPWLLELIADQLTAIITRHGGATVLLIHGWNIIEPRVDFGLGLREVAGTLQPPAGAHVAAADAFIRGPVMALAAHLREAQILPTFGLRYPGGAAQNLLQGFTRRHAAANIAPLQRLASMAANSTINALQLEMSVTLRLPGVLREKAIRAISGTFSTVNYRTAPDRGISIVRASKPASSKKKANSNAPPWRVGVEFFDPIARLGGMVSFDFGPGASGGRIMLLFDGCRVALFTAEGKAEYANERISIGALELNAIAGGGLHFRGPCVVVDNGTAYLSVERALTDSHLDQAEVDAGLEFDRGTPSFGALLAELDRVVAGAHTSDISPRELSHSVQPRAAFGRLRGTIRLNGSSRKLDAAARIGASFSGLGTQKFIVRKMLWASFRSANGHDAFEGRVLELEGEHPHRIARTLRGGRWTDCELKEIRVGVSSPPGRPEFVEAAAITASGDQIALRGKPETFVVLSRPRLDGSRIHSVLGFAEYQLGELSGAGMYEFSRQVGKTLGTIESEN